MPRDYALAVETVNCRRLVKGYSDTHVRGGGKYRQLLAAAEQLVGRPDAAASLRALRDTALADEKCGPMERQLAEKLAA
ncbi:putative indolepyruvate oxidoreductase subunit B [compost metagenome]